MDVSVEQRILVPKDYEYIAGYVQGTFKYVYENATLFEKLVLEAMLGERQARRMSAKIRCSYLQVGDFPCANPGWHYDLVADKDAPGEETHHIWVNSIPPVFAGTIVLEPESVYSYGRVKHRATRATREGWRLFIRLSESSIIHLTNRSTREHGSDSVRGHQEIPVNGIPQYTRHHSADH